MAEIKNEGVYEITMENGDFMYLVAMFSGNPAATEGCDACIGYTLYDEDQDEIDGGEMDYDSEEKKYDTIDDALDDVLDFALDGRPYSVCQPSALDPEDFD